MKRLLLLIITLCFSLVSRGQCTCCGTFVAGQVFSSSTALTSTDVDLADLDGDGDLDAFVTNQYDPNKVWLNNGTGTFISNGQSLDNNNSWHVELADVDNDGDKDAFVANANGCELWLNNGNANFTNSNQNFDDSYSVGLADLDGDADLDVFIGGWNSPSKVLLNDGNGNFTNSGQNLGNHLVNSVLLDDSDNDGDIDAVLITHSGGSEVWLNDGNAIFTEKIQSTQFSSSWAGNLGDFNGDGFLDIITNGALYENDGNANFLLNTGGISFPGGYDIGCGDFDNDGDVDLYFARSSDNRVFFNDGNSNFTNSGQSLGSKNSYSVAIGDLDNDGDLDAFDGNYETSTGSSERNQIWINSNSFQFPLDFAVQPTCFGACDGSATVTVSGGQLPLTYLWDDPNTQITNTATGLCAGYHSVQVTDFNNCSITDSILVPFQDTTSQSICLITVDTLSQYNIVVWEKPITNLIDSFYIYRNIVGAYTKVGAVSYDSLSQFIDTSNGINPNITSYRYKISSLDSCGYETSLSDFHETIHLTVSSAGGNIKNLIWDNYEGFSFVYYRIWRDDFGNGNWNLLDSVTSSNTTYTDITSPSLNSNYFTEVIPPSTCTSTKAVDHNSARSNRESGVAGPSSISEINPYNLTVHPNPTNNLITLEIEGYNGLVNVEVYDLQGRLLETTTNTTISMQEYAKGIYVFKVAYGDRTQELKVVKE